MLPRGTVLLVCRSRWISTNTLRQAKSATTHRQYKLSPWERFGRWFRHTLGEAYKQSFEEETVELFHKKDKLSAKEWILIYNDLAHVRFRFLMIILIPSALFTFIYGLHDYQTHGRKFSLPRFERVRREAYEIGYFRYVVFFLMSCSAFFLIRSIQLRVYRIYQNIQDPYKYYVYRSRSLIFAEWRIIPRSEIKPTEVFYDFAERLESMNKGRRFLRRLISGHAMLGGKRAIIEEIFFRSNNLRTFMVHETNAVPRQIVDLQKKLLSDESSDR